MTEPLSHAAQAVLDAAMQYEINPECYSREIAATALRTVAHHLQRCSPWPNDAEGIGVDWSTSELHDIAAELES